MASDPGLPRPQLTMADLTRWEESGAAWRTIDVDDRRAVVELCACTGEPVDVVSGEAPELIAFVRARRAHPRLG